MDLNSVKMLQERLATSLRFMHSFWCLGSHSFSQLIASSYNGSGMDARSTKNVGGVDCITCTYTPSIWQVISKRLSFIPALTQQGRRKQTK